MIGKLPAPDRSGVAARPAERREFGRRRTCKPAQILSPGGAAIGCIVVNMSEGGAALRVSGSEAAPDTFHLLIEADDLVVLCRVAHRTACTIGVEFLRSPRLVSRLNSRGSQLARLALRAGDQTAIPSRDPGPSDPIPPCRRSSAEFKARGALR